MIKKIQTFSLFVGLSLWLVGHHPAFAESSCTDLVPQNNFFSKNEHSILNFGIKGWAKGTKKTIQKHWAIGGEMAVGPVIEWHPLNGIGIQTGLLYSYNAFYTVDFSIDRKRLLDTGLLAFWSRLGKEINALSAKNEGYVVHAALVNIQFHAITIPLFFRFYPEKSRKWVCYGGPRLILIFFDLKRKQYCPVCINTSIIKGILYNLLTLGKCIADQRSITGRDIQDLTKRGLYEICCSTFKINSDSDQNSLPNHKVWHWDFGWDFGIEFRGSSGIVIGMNGLGLVLGYDFVRRKNTL
ncbi:hypothetical protein [Cardinium endosymbiont of Nabis limbatus]|uniref:hypothetical protein n=1 Tax=Cardinium endosymbiont of Nabis limbatus TaxID=3066217 RepID=UPI003AF3B468